MRETDVERESKDFIPATQHDVDNEKESKLLLLKFLFTFVQKINGNFFSANNRILQFN